MAETLREFLVNVGFKVDESTWGRFQSTITAATLQAKLLGDALEGMAKAVANHVAGTVQHFEALYWQTQRLGQSAESIRAFGYAISQMGGSVAQANGMLSSFAQFMSTTPGGEQFLERLGVKVRGKDGKYLEYGEQILNATDRFRELSKMGQAGKAQASQIAGVVGLGYEDFQTLASGGDGRKYYDEELGRARSAGIVNSTVKAAAEASQQFRKIWQELVDFAEGAEGRLMIALKGPIEALANYLDAHKAEINARLGEIADAFARLSENGVRQLADFDWEKAGKDFLDTAHSIAEFVRAIGDLIGKLEDLNERSKQWWIMRLMNWSVSPSASPGGIYGAETNPDAPHSASVPEAVGGAIRRGWNYLTGRGNGPGAPASIRARGLLGGNQRTLAQESYNFWRSQGLNHDMALAELGNERGEDVLEAHSRGKTGDHGISGGSAQWQQDRRDRILAAIGIDVFSTSTTHLQMLQAMRWEQEFGTDSPKTRVWNALKSGRLSRGEGVERLVRGYERSLNQDSDIAIRWGHANAFEKGGIGPSAPAVGSRVPPSTGASGGGGSTVHQTNNITVQGISDANAAAAGIGSHLDRTATDIASNLRGAAQ